MEIWKTGLQGERLPKNPSFSSALLDAIYRSTVDVDSDLFVYRKTTTTMRERIYKDDFVPKRTSRVDKWTSYEKKAAAEKIALRRRASELGLLDAGRHASSTRRNLSEADYVSFSRREKLHHHHLPKVAIPAKNNNTVKSDHFDGRKPEEFTRSRGFPPSAKPYNELKKPKQPISPGARIANFLNSLFATAKKAKISSSTPPKLLSPFFPNSGDRTARSWSSTATMTTSSTTTTPSTATMTTSSTTTTPSSRSCLSKSSTGSSTRANGVRRSVRFYPMSAIVGEDSQPCGEKYLCLNGEETAKAAPLMSEKVKASARQFLADYDSKPNAFVIKFSPRSKLYDGDQEVGEGNEDDDTASDSSSDLFELENLTAVGMRELPVYETTDVHKNHAIARGLIL